MSPMAMTRLADEDCKCNLAIEADWDSAVFFDCYRANARKRAAKQTGSGSVIDEINKGPRSAQKTIVSMNAKTPRDLHHAGFCVSLSRVWELFRVRGHVGIAL